MSDFIAHVIAELDTSKAQQQLNAFKNGKHTIDVDVNLTSKNGNVNTILNQIKSQFQSAGVSAGQSFSKNVNASLNNIDLSKTKTEINNLKNSLQNFGFNDSSIKNITSELNNLKVTVTGITHTMNGKNLDVTVTGVDSLNRTVTAVQTFDAISGDLISQSSKVKQSFKQMFTDADTSKLNASILSLDASFIKLEGSSNKYSASIQKLKTDLAGLDNISDLGKRQSEFERITSDVNKLSLKYKQAKADSDALNASQQLLSNKTILGNQIETWMNKNTKAAKIYKDQLESLQKQLSAVSNIAELKAVSSEFSKIKSTSDAAGNSGRSYVTQLMHNITNLSPLFGMGAMINTAIRGLKDMYQNVVSIDTAMTELKKVTDETGSSYSNFLSTASERAIDLGTTVSDYINATASFARLGYGLNDAKELAEVANIYSVVGDEVDNIDEASSSVISTLQAFSIEASNAISIVDKFNAVGNNFAISSGGIGEALTRSASSMSAANNTLDETIALITAANTVVQDPTTVGTAFKTISMRIRGATTELEEAGLETDGMAQSTAKLREEIMALSGVDIMLDENTFKSTYKIMEELSTKWKDLTDIQQASITELIAGKRQGNVVSALMSNFDIAQNALQTSLNSEGSAMAEHEKWMDSIEARVNQLKASWQSLSQSFLDSGFVKGAVTGLKGIVEGIDWLIQKIGTLGTLGAGAGIVALIKIFGSSNEFALYGCESIVA